MGFAVCHIQKRAGNDAPVTAHIGRRVHPANADQSREYLNEQLVDYPEGVRRGREVGTAIKIKQDTKVLSLGFLINVNKYDEAKFRVSFYALDGETPSELLVNKDITFDLKGQVKDRFELDLSPYDIWLEGGQEVLVTLTLLDEDMTDKSAFWLNGVLLSGKGLFIRRPGEGAWTRMGGTTISMYLNARVYK